MFRFAILLLTLTYLGCKQPEDTSSALDIIPESTVDLQANTPALDKEIRGALLTTRFSSFEEFSSKVEVQYYNVTPGENQVMLGKPMVSLTHRCQGREVRSVLISGVNESDFVQARDGGFWDRVRLAMYSPYAVVNRWDLQRVSILARRWSIVFGEGDVAFFYIAENMVSNIFKEDYASLDAKDLTEKGYLNTFNHITAQAIMTSIFSERLADFIADAHERHNLPELITGNFTEEQIKDIENGPVDNMVDMINNEWGQELGKVLRKKYQITRKTYWTPELMANYLNDVQSYYSWAFQIGFEPFKTSDEKVIRFSFKINRVMTGISEIKASN